MILSVFKWLPKKALIRCSLVCHRFNRVSQDESLWSRLDLAGKVIQPYALGRIVLRGVIILRVAQCKVNDHSIYVDAHALQTLSPLPYHLIADSRADIQDQRAADAQIHQ